MVIRAHECVMVGSSRSIDDMMVHSFAWIHLKEKVQHEPTLLRAHLLLLPYLHHLTTHFFPSFVQPFQDGFERFANGKLITVFSATERYTTKSPKRANMYTIFCRYHIVVSQIESEDHLLPGLLWPPQECWRIALCSAGPNNCTKVGNSGVNKMWRCSELRSDTSNFKSLIQIMTSRLIYPVERLTAMWDPHIMQQRPPTPPRPVHNLDLWRVLESGTTNILSI